jgi:glucose/arabinose dehydrogenase
MLAFQSACQPQPPVVTLTPTQKSERTSTPVKPSPSPFFQNTPHQENEPTQPMPTMQIYANEFPDAKQFEWRLFETGFTKPLDFVVPNDGTERIFIVEQQGLIHIIQSETILNNPFLDIRSKVQTEGGEQGLLGLAFSQNYPNDQMFFINYTDRNGNTAIARYLASTDPNIADPDSEEILLNFEQPYRNHNGGDLEFGPEGFLYIPIGDGGSAGDPQNFSQNMDVLLGKILRIDVSGKQGYEIPADNPDWNTGMPNEIWASGLRNPWRLTFDSLTGDTFIADVGQDEWEEIHWLPANHPGGVNFGWPFYEGTHPYKGIPEEDVFYELPIIEYDHSEGRSITGGYVYRGKNLPEWNGIYVYGDFVFGGIWGTFLDEDSWRSQKLFQTSFRISSFGIDHDGEIYLLDYQSGNIYQLVRKGS